MYMVNRFNIKIQPVEVDRCTANSVWVNGRRYSKHSHYEQFYSTWGDAYEALMHRLRNDAFVARMAWNEAEDLIVKAEKMRGERAAFLKEKEAQQ